MKWLVLAFACSTDATCPDLAAHATSGSAQDVRAILAANCAVGGCHLTAPGAGRLVLDMTSPAWTDALVDVRADESPSLMLVAPGDPDGSWLVHKLFGDFCGTPCIACGGQMPPIALSDDERGAIVAWIADGARD